MALPDTELCNIRSCKSTNILLTYLKMANVESLSELLPLKITAT
jgi:hypothetical protein